MKKILLFITVMILSLSILTSCALLKGLFGGNTDSGDIKNPSDGGKDDGYSYTDFSPSEKKLITDFLGELIPFVPNNEYYVEKNLDQENNQEYISFYTFGNTQLEFSDYQAMYSSYTFVKSYDDTDGDSWYCYEKGNIYIELGFYFNDGNYVIDVYAYHISDTGNNGGSTGNNGGNTGNNGGSTGGNGGSTGGNGGSTGVITYTDFTSEEKALFIEYFGEVIPFISNNNYTVEEYNYTYEDTGEYEEGINFYTYGNTQAEFNAYRALFSSYTYDGTENDEHGDAWYYYTSSSDFYVDMSYYQTESNEYVIDVYVYFLYESGTGSGGNGNTGTGGTGTGGTGTGGTGTGGTGTGGTGSGSTDTNVITNAGAGLPTGTNGVYNIDFTTATHVKKVSDQGYYIDGCPTTDSPAVLVIPVDFSDVTASSKGYSIDTIVNAFEKDGEVDYYSVYDYYYISSYGKLSLDITVLDYWFRPANSSSYYEEATYDYYGSQVEIGDQLIIDEALKYLENIMDLSEFDSDNNGVIDSIVLVNTLDIDGDTNFKWAYRYWNIYTDSEGYYYEYDGVSANDYLWMSCGFLHEEYDANGDVNYDVTNSINTYTAIHEFGHVLGADDYYNTAAEGEHPMDGCDVMDYMTGDHNAYTKFNYGWLTTSRLVTTTGSVTLTLEDFSKNGDTIIIANNWNPDLGAYQEYYVVVYYTMTGLNGDGYGYFGCDGILVYHVNSSLYTEEIDGETYYDVYNNNTDPSDQYGTEDNLIEFVKSSEGKFTYAVGDSLPTTTDDQGNALGYTFTVDSLTDGVATITFTKK